MSNYFDEVNEIIEERVKIAREEGSMSMQLKIMKLINKMIYENKKIEPSDLITKISQLK